MQLDCYGQLLEAAWLYAQAGGELTEDNWHFLAGVADIVVERWRLPDQGIWEIRDDPRHFVHSKLNCWVALDRAVKLAEAGGIGRTTFYRTTPYLAFMGTGFEHREAVSDWNPPEMRIPKPGDRERKKIKGDAT